MNDGVRRSLLVARIARLQAEDAMEAEGIALSRRESAGSSGRTAVPEPPSRGRMLQMKPLEHGAALGMMIQRAAYSQAQGGSR